MSKTELETKEKANEDTHHKDPSILFEHTELSVPTEDQNEFSEELEQKVAPPMITVLSACTIFALTHKTPYTGIGAFLGQAIFMYLLYAWSHKHCRPLSRESWVAGSFALLFSLSDVITTSSIAHQFNQTSFWISNTLLLGFGFGIPFIHKHPFSLIKNMISVLYKGVSFIPLRKFLYTPDQDIIRPYTKGFSISAPILCIFFVLFSQADPNFAKNSFSILQSLTGESAGDVIYGIICLLATLTLLLLITENVFGKTHRHLPLQEQPPSIQQETNIVLTLVNGLFAAFLFSQTAYLFGGEEYRYAQNLNYAEYAVAGFYELMVVVGLVIFMSLSLRTFHQERSSILQKSLYAILLTQSLLILCSAFNRMSLYIDVYGYTQARIFGIVFILTAGIGLLLSMRNIFIEEKQEHLLKQLLVAGACGGLLFGFIQPDTHSAQWNIEAEENFTTAQFLQKNKDTDPGTILALLEREPQAKTYFRYSQYCTADFRSFQLTRFALCQKLK